MAVAVVAVVAGVETAQTGATAIPTLTVVEVVVRVFSLNTTGPDCQLGVYTDVSVVNVVVDVVMLVLDYRLFDDIGADQGPRRMMWVLVGVVNRRESGVTCHCSKCPFEKNKTATSPAGRKKKKKN